MTKKDIQEAVFYAHEKPEVLANILSDILDRLSDLEDTSSNS